MPGNQSNNGKEDLTSASETLRENASRLDQHLAAQATANRRWELYYRQEAQKARSSSNSRRTTGRS